MRLRLIIIKVTLTWLIVYLVVVNITRQTLMTVTRHTVRPLTWQIQEIAALQEKKSSVDLRSLLKALVRKMLPKK